MKLVREAERDWAAGEHHEGEGGFGGVEAVGATDDERDARWVVDSVTS